MSIGVVVEAKLQLDRCWEGTRIMEFGLLFPGLDSECMVWKIVAYKTNVEGEEYELEATYHGIHVYYADITFKKNKLKMKLIA